MRLSLLAAAVVVSTAAACGMGQAPGSPAPQPSRSIGSPSLVGRWALVSLAIAGVDRTPPVAAGAKGVVYYTFNPDRTFRIELGDSVRETGAWSVDTTASPKWFDHIPDGPRGPGPPVPGIYRIDGDTLQVSIWPPNPANRRPTRFWSAASDSSWLLIFTRAAH